MTGFWRPPWGFPAAALAVAGVVLPAAAVQALHPDLAVALPAPPASWLAVALPVLALVAAQRRWPQAALLLGLGGVPAGLMALFAAALVSAPVAIWPGGADAPAWLRRLGLADAIASLPFAAAYMVLVANLAISGARHLWAPRPGSWTVVVVHAGLVTCLTAAAVGLGNTVRARVWLEEGAPAARRAQRIDDGRPVPLPAAVALRDFQLETWEATLAVGSHAGGAWRYQPGRMAVRPGIEERLGRWTVRVLAVIPQAAVAEGGPRPFPQPGAGPAARVAVADAAGALVAEGWVHPPTAYGPPLILPLGDDGALLMPPLRPRVYRSLLTVDGREVELEVNHPLVVDGWWLYQTGYDEERGGASTRSQIEAVRDPALGGIYLGVAILLAGVLLRLWRLGRDLAALRGGAAP